MRTAVLILAILFPVVAAADDGPVVVDTDQTAVTSGQRPAARPVVGPPEPKRRGSMVGYIDDATIDDHVRVRFDAGFDNNVPDRAEFFYAQCGCNFAGAPGPGGPGPGDLVTSLNFQQLTIDGQYALKRRGAESRIAVFASIPVRFVQPQNFLGQTFRPPVPNTFQNASGLSDIRVGVKGAIVSSDDITLTAQVQAYFKSGDAKKGLGTDHGSVEFSLLWKQKLSDQLGLESEFGDWHPTGGSTAPTGQSYSGDVLFYGIGPSYDLVNTGRVRFAPVLELVGWHVLGGQQQNAGTLGPADGTNIVNLKIGARTTFDNRSSVYVGWGHALTAAMWYRDIVRVEYRYSF
jgi:hypothetical protein